MQRLQEVLGARLRAFRQIAGYSIEELAHKADMNAAQLGKVERGERNSTVQTLERIVAALGVTYEDLFDFSKDAAVPSNSVIGKTLLLLSALNADEQTAIYRTAELFAVKKE